MDDIWTTSCGSCKHEHLKYAVQVTLGSFVIAFSMFQIVYSDVDRAVSYSMISGTLGLFLPSPGMMHMSNHV